MHYNILSSSAVTTYIHHRPNKLVISDSVCGKKSTFIACCLRFATIGHFTAYQECMPSKQCRLHTQLHAILQQNCFLLLAICTVQGLQDSNMHCTEKAD